MLRIAGLCFVVFGGRLLWDHIFRSFRFGNLDFGVHHALFGLLFLTVGLLLIASTLRKRRSYGERRAGPGKNAHSRENRLPSPQAQHGRLPPLSVGGTAMAGP